MNKHSVLVTGGAGYIGSHVVLALLEAGYRPVVLDNLSTGRRDLVAADAKFIEGEVSSQDQVVEIIRRENCSSVLHFAGSIQVAESVENPLKYYQNNVANTVSLLQTCLDQAVDKVVFSSSAAVYQSRTDRAIREDDLLLPSNPYGYSKLFVEQILADLAATEAIRYISLRYFNVAGADPLRRTGQCGEETTHLIKRACQTAIGILPEIAVFGTDYETPDGTCQRDYIHVSDLASAHVAALDHLMADGQGGIFNCGYGRGYSVMEVLDAVDRKLPTPIKRTLSPRRPGDAPSLIADSRLLRRTLNWRPEHDDLDHIIETALAWERHLWETTR